jgi:hypothetical protein
MDLRNVCILPQYNTQHNTTQHNTTQHNTESQPRRLRHAEWGVRISVSISMSNVAYPLICTKPKLHVAHFLKKGSSYKKY